MWQIFCSSSWKMKRNITIKSEWKFAESEENYPTFNQCLKFHIWGEMRIVKRVQTAEFSENEVDGKGFVESMNVCFSFSWWSWKRKTLRSHTEHKSNRQFLQLIDVIRHVIFVPKDDLKINNFPRDECVSWRVNVFHVVNWSQSLQIYTSSPSMYMSRHKFYSFVISSTKIKCVIAARTHNTL